MLDAINGRRSAAGLPALQREEHLERAAWRHTLEMAEHDVLEHVSEGSGTPADRVHAEGLSIADIGENVSMHHATSDAQTSLEASPPHLANMTSARFTHVGLAAVRDGDMVYVTQVFGRLEPAEPTATAPETTAPPIAALPLETAVPASTGPLVLPPSSGPAPAAPLASAASASPMVVLPPSAPTAPVASTPATTVMVPAPGAMAVAGYWVCAQERWWYYPMPAGARAGQQLQPDLSVRGAPPGQTEGRCVAGASTLAYAPPVAPPALVGTPAYLGPAPRAVYAAPRAVSAAPRAVYAAPPPRTVYVAPPRARPMPGVVIPPYGGGVVIDLGFGPRR